MSRGCIYNIDFKTNNNEMISVSSDYFDHFFIANLNENGDEINYLSKKGSEALVANFFMIRIYNELNEISENIYTRLLKRKDVVSIIISFTNGRKQEFEIVKKRIASNGTMINKFEDIFEFDDSFGIVITDKNLKYKKELFV